MPTIYWNSIYCLAFCHGRTEFEYPTQCGRKFRILFTALKHFFCVSLSKKNEWNRPKCAAFSNKVKRKKTSLNNNINSIKTKPIDKLCAIWWTSVRYFIDRIIQVFRSCFNYVANEISCSHKDQTDWNSKYLYYFHLRRKKPTKISSRRFPFQEFSCYFVVISVHFISILTCRENKCVHSLCTKSIKSNTQNGNFDCLFIINEKCEWWADCECCGWIAAEPKEQK